MEKYLPERLITFRTRHPAVAEATDEMERAALLAITTAGSPTSIAATTWVDEFLAARSEGPS